MPTRKPARRRKPAARRRPRKVLNPRPIPLDEKGIEDLLDRLYFRLGEKAERYGAAKANTSRTPIVIAKSTVWVSPVNRHDEQVTVILTAAPMVVRYVGSGGYGHVNADGRPVVVIEMNGLYPWDVLADERVTRDALRVILRHELTHAVDTQGGPSAKFRGGAKNKGLAMASLSEVESLDDYYNDPREVRAYMRQMFDELHRNVTKIMRSPLGREWGLGGTISRMLNTNETWGQVSPHLTLANRRRILRGLVRAFHDDGL